MPVMDGLTATNIMRVLPRADAATVPIIAMTADAYAALLFFRPNQIAYIRALAGKYFIIEILFPVNISNTVLQFFNGSTQCFLFFCQHFFSWHDG